MLIAARRDVSFFFKKNLVFLIMQYSNILRIQLRRVRNRYTYMSYKTVCCLGPVISRDHL